MSLKNLLSSWWKTITGASFTGGSAFEIEDFTLEDQPIKEDPPKTLEPMTEKKCQIIDVPALAKGWGCCQDGCKTYNGDVRDTCKHCGHQYCGEERKTKVIPYETEHGTIVLQEIKTPDTDRSKLN